MFRLVVVVRRTGKTFWKHTTPETFPVVLVFYFFGKNSFIAPSHNMLHMLLEQSTRHKISTERSENQQQKNYRKLNI
jgi:hypothetical protein